MAEIYQELQKLSDDELIECYDNRAKATEFWADHYLGVLNRRHQERHTKQIKWMTVAITIATLVNVAFFTYGALT